jgi:hypothetical protein
MHLLDSLQFQQSWSMMQLLKLQLMQLVMLNQTNCLILQHKLVIPSSHLLNALCLC